MIRLALSFGMVIGFVWFCCWLIFFGPERDYRRNRDAEVYHQYIWRLEHELLDGPYVHRYRELRCPWC